jgi:hypothetical protein
LPDSATVTDCEAVVAPTLPEPVTPVRPITKDTAAVATVPTNELPVAATVTPDDPSSKLSFWNESSWKFVVIYILILLEEAEV